MKRGTAVALSSFILCVLLHMPAYSQSSDLLPPDADWVSQTIKQLSLRDKVAQLVQVRVMGRYLHRQSSDFLRLAVEVQENKVGGVILFAGNVYESAVLLNRLQDISPLPLIVSADFERGVSFRIADTTSFPWTMAIGATGSEEYAFQQGAITAREARALGVHWIFAPVMDVNNNPDNPVINIRAYGEDPRLVARLGAAFIRGCQANGALTTAKHFPGHGDTATDTHIGLAVVPSDSARLESVELVPFRSAVEAGVDSIMTAHVAVPKMTGKPDIPATLSPEILTDLLRRTLNFKGLVVTDAMEMGGITTRFWTGEAAVRAFKAGADMILLPPDTTVAIDEIVRAVQRGEISEAQINTSLGRVLTVKTRLGLHRRRTVPVEQIDQVIAAPESLRVAQEIADHSITLLRDQNRMLPLNPLGTSRVFSLTLSSDLDAAPIFQSELRRRLPSVRTASADSRPAPQMVESIGKSAREADVIVCATVVRVVSGRGNVALPDSQRTLVERLISSGKPIIWVAFGNPYVLRLFPEVPGYMCTFSYSDVSQVAAAKALTGEIAISGKMPVSIPGLSRVGEGLQIPRLDLTLKAATGSSAAGLPRVREVLGSYIEQKVFPGASLFVGYKGSVVLESTPGGAGPDDAVYKLGSLSHMVGTTSGAMMLTESGRLLLGEPVQRYLPEFQGPGKNMVLVENLLAHTSGLPAVEPKSIDSATGFEAKLLARCAIPLEYEPGTQRRYSEVGMALLREILTRVAGKPLIAVLRERLFNPLGLKSVDAEFEVSPTRNMVAGARDLAVFAQMLLNRGWYDHRRIFSPATMDRFAGRANADRALGWDKPAAETWTARLFTPSAFGWIDPGGAMLWVDPEKQLFLVLLASRGSGDNRRFEEAAQAISEAAVRALSEPGAGAAKREAPERP
jgi:beta-glucosidase-like glycosyl hydrolase/CubicO group peptidase (beta-lactamase class C family)